MQDPFGNFQARLVFPEKVRELTIAVDLVAEMTVINPFDFFVGELRGEISLRLFEATLRQELAPVSGDAGKRSAAQEVVDRG
jgi:transglutaminase-like putative cysteine protease